MTQKQLINSYIVQLDGARSYDSARIQRKYNFTPAVYIDLTEPALNKERTYSEIATKPSEYKKEGECHAPFVVFRYNGKGFGRRKFPLFEFKL